MHEFEKWVGVIAGTELIRFSGSTCLLLGSGYILKRYLKAFLVQQQLWEQSGALFERILRQEREAMGNLSPLSPVESNVADDAGVVRLIHNNHTDPFDIAIK